MRLPVSESAWLATKAQECYYTEIFEWPRTVLMWASEVIVSLSEWLWECLSFISSHSAGLCVIAELSKGELFFILFFLCVSFSLKKLFFKFIYFWLHWVFTAAHGLPLFVTRRDSSLVGVGHLLVAVALLIVSTGSEVVVHGLSCLVACGILDQGLNLCLLNLQADLLTTGPPGKSPKVCLLLEIVF